MLPETASFLLRAQYSYSASCSTFPVVYDVGLGLLFSQGLWRASGGTIALIGITFTGAENMKPVPTKTSLLVLGVSLLTFQLRTSQESKKSREERVKTLEKNEKVSVCTNLRLN